MLLTASNRKQLIQCVHFSHLLVSYNKESRGEWSRLGSASPQCPAAEGESLQPSLPFTHSLDVSARAPISHPHPVALYKGGERDKQKGTLLLRCYLMSFLREEKSSYEHPQQTFPSIK